MMQMFNNKYRYIFILVLAVYSYANSLFSSVYSHYNINAPGYDILLVFILITWLVWDGNRIIGYKMKADSPEDKPIRRMVIFFLTGSLYATLISLLVLY